MSGKPNDQFVNANMVIHSVSHVESVVVLRLVSSSFISSLASYLPCLRFYAIAEAVSRTGVSRETEYAGSASDF